MTLDLPKTLNYSITSYLVSLNSNYYAYANSTKLLTNPYTEELKFRFYSFFLKQTAQTCLSQFFLTNGWVLPQHLRRINSLFRLNYWNIVLKISSIFSTHGRSKKVITLTTQTLTQLNGALTQIWLKSTQTQRNLGLLLWWHLHLPPINLKFKQYSTPQILTPLQKYFESIDMVFRFTFHKIDKNVRKFSRGKSGTYKTVFQYVPPFKRNSVKLRLLKQNLNYRLETTFAKKFKYILVSALFFTKKSYPYLIHQLTHRKVIKIYAKSLFRTTHKL